MNSIGKEILENLKKEFTNPTFRDSSSNTKVSINGGQVEVLRWQYLEAVSIQGY